MKNIYIFLIIISANTFAQTIDKEEAQKAFEYLNNFRQNPNEVKIKLDCMKKNLNKKPLKIENEIIYHSNP